MDILHGLPWAVQTLKAFPDIPEPEETGATFEENALIKALYYRNAFNMPCIADDSGLEVDALKGAPGVFSARYAGPGCTYDDNNRKLLTALLNVPDHARTARFVCCAAFADTDASIYIVRGTVEGWIAFTPAGDNGFGYDPIFIPDGENRTFAEFSASEKHSISHRGRAFRRFREYLEITRCTS